MTEVDTKLETILRKREFNQALVKYRQVNMSEEGMIPEIRTSEFEAAQKLAAQPIVDMEELYRPVASLIANILKSKGKRDDLKSRNNVLKMLAGLYTTKITAMQRKLSDPVALMNLDCFFFHHIQQKIHRY